MKYMKKIAFFGTIIFIVLISTASEDMYYFKINKSFDIFGEVFRDISSNYVAELDPEALMKFGIDGILNSLDPYTDYYSGAEADDLDIITTGSYTGLGITVATVDSMLTIINVYDGFTAQRNGLRIGDKLYKIDSSVVLWLGSGDLRKYTNGKPGSPLDLWVIRDGLRDTLMFKLQREQVKLKNISYSGFIRDSIAYIKLDRFSTSTSEELKETINKLKKLHVIKGLIFDLRDNPGGVLQAAVQTCEIFVPQGSKIVSTIGRRPENVRTYYTQEDPMEPFIPIAVLINEKSASASEIVAGAIQDLDRGIILGSRSYGKGLVQSVFELPFNSSLKMTTARYYTPSGRCIQKLEFLNKDLLLYKEDAKTSESKEFYTQNGRKVLENNGISPDSTIGDEVLPNFIEQLEKAGIIFGFANEYASKLDTLPKNFKADSKLLADFSKYIENKDISKKTPLLGQFSQTLKLASAEALSKNTLNQLKLMESNLRKEEYNLIKKYSKQLGKLLEYEISSRLLTENDYYDRFLPRSRLIMSAADIISSEKYYGMLSKKGKP
ncbi:MAG: hypothetical protein QG635_2008 [Bacteroidota bacterium]|nr:hypothetical protein [Bacteroidota bacterium]